MTHLHRIGILVALGLLLLAWCPARAELPLAAQGDRVRVLAFNIRLSVADDGDDSWPHRKQLVADLIREESPDFLGVQEAILHRAPELNQVAYLRKQLPEYAVLVRSRQVTPDEGESTPLFYREDRWRMDDRQHGTFWLSDTPEEPGSTSWGNSIPRIVTWAYFHERATGRSVYVYNTHFDHRSETSRRRSAVLMAQRIAAREDRDAPVYVTGDFNCGESSVGIEYLKGHPWDEAPPPPVELVDSFRVLHPEAEVVGTFNGFDGEAGGAKIDYVFVTPETEVFAARIIRDNKGGRYPSDHFPVMAEVALPAAGTGADDRESPENSQ